MSVLINTQSIRSSLEGYVTARESFPNRGRTFFFGKIKGLSREKIDSVKDFLCDLKPLEKKGDLKGKLINLLNQSGFTFLVSSYS